MTVLRLKSGDHRTLRFEIKAPDGTPQDLTGASFAMHVAPTLFSDASFTKTTSGGGAAVVGSPINGIVDIAIIPADTAALSGYFVYEFQITDAFSKIFTVQHATPFYEHIEIEPDLIVP
jgi:hypothetical protein